MGSCRCSRRAHTAPVSDRPPTPGSKYACAKCGDTAVWEEFGLMSPGAYRSCPKCHTKVGFDAGGRPDGLRATTWPVTSSD